MIGERVAAHEQGIIRKIHAKSCWKSETRHRGMLCGNQVDLIDGNRLAEIDLHPFRFVGRRRDLALVSEALAGQLGFRLLQSVEILLKLLDSGVELLQFRTGEAGCHFFNLAPSLIQGFVFPAARSAGSRAWPDRDHKVVRRDQRLQKPPEADSIPSAK